MEWVAISFSRGSSQSRDQTWVSHIVGRCFGLNGTKLPPPSPMFFQVFGGILSSTQILDVKSPLRLSSRYSLSLYDPVAPFTTCSRYCKLSTHCQLVFPSSIMHAVKWNTGFSSFLWGFKGGHVTEFWVIRPNVKLEFLESFCFPDKRTVEGTGFFLLLHAWNL